MLGSVKSTLVQPICHNWSVKKICPELRSSHPSHLEEPGLALPSQNAIQYCLLPFQNSFPCTRALSKECAKIRLKQFAQDYEVVIQVNLRSTAPPPPPPPPPPPRNAIRGDRIRQRPREMVSLKYKNIFSSPPEGRVVNLLTHAFNRKCSGKTTLVQKCTIRRICPKLRSSRTSHPEESSSPRPDERGIGMFSAVLALRLV